MIESAGAAASFKRTPDGAELKNSVLTSAGIFDHAERPASMGGRPLKTDTNSALVSAMAMAAEASQLVQQSISNEHYTPAQYIEAARAVMGRA